MNFIRMAMCCLCIGTSSAAEILFDGSGADLWSAKKPLAAADGVVKTDLSYVPMLSREFIPVKKDKKYTISGEFRMMGQKVPMLYFGVIPYTEDGREIPFAAIQPAGPQIAVLTGEAAAGSRSVTLKNAADWKFKATCRLAFHASPDKSDLPNLDLSPAIQVSEIIFHPDHTVEVAFKSPLKKSYPAGTPVRMHLSGNSYIYAGYGNKKGEWMKFSRTYKSFYRGCAKIRPAISVMSAKYPVEFRNVKVSEE